MLLELTQNNYNLAIKIIMKNILISILITLTFISCSTDNSPKSAAKMDLRNYLALLNHFGVEKKTDLDLFALNDSCEEKFKRYFDFPIRDQLKYSVNYRLVDQINIPIRVQSRYYENCTPPMMLRGANCFVLLNYQGRVILDGESCEMQSIGDRIVSFYKKKDVNLRLKKAIIMFYWDKGVDEIYFRQVMNQIIKGYFEYAEAQSEKYFHKSISELSSSKLKSLGEIFPFNLCVDFIKMKKPNLNLVDMPVVVCED